MQTLNLDWRPLFRDAFVYGLSIAVFIGFAWDGKFQWWEALIILLIYVAYIVIMKFNKYLMMLLAKIECGWCRYIYMYMHLLRQLGIHQIFFTFRNESRIEPDEEEKVNDVAEEEAQVTILLCSS